MSNDGSKTINRLKGNDNYRFLRWFDEQAFEYGLSDSQIAVRATDALGFTVTVGNVYGAWDTTGKKRPKIPVDGDAKIQILKRHLEYLTVQLSKSMPGIVLPPEWTDL